MYKNNNQTKQTEQIKADKHREILDLNQSDLSIFGIDVRSAEYYTPVQYVESFSEG